MKSKTLLLALLAAGGLFNATLRAEDGSALTPPVKTVYDHYLKIQSELANDSTKNVSENAIAIARAVRGEGTKLLPPDVATQADTLAKATDIKAAREAFRPLSASLIKVLSVNKAGKDSYHEAYCPMAKASWLQSETSIKNPYFGKAMLDCGVLKN